MYYNVPTGRITFRSVDEIDAPYIVKWRNSQVARDSFYNKDVVTEDTHIEFCKSRIMHDLVWIVETPNDGIVGITSLTVDVQNHQAEYGRTFIDPIQRGKHYAMETEFLVLHYGFEVLRLNEIWGSLYASNRPIIELHIKTGYDIMTNLPERKLVKRCYRPLLREPLTFCFYDRNKWETFGKQQFEQFLAKYGEKGQ